MHRYANTLLSFTPALTPQLLYPTPFSSSLIPPPLLPSSISPVTATANREDVVKNHGVILLSMWLSNPTAQFARNSMTILSYVAKVYAICDSTPYPALLCPTLALLSFSRTYPLPDLDIIIPHPQLRCSRSLYPIHAVPPRYLQRAHGTRCDQTSRHLHSSLAQ